MLMWIVGIFFIVIIFAIVFLQIYLSGPVYHGQPSDHFNGKKFFNYGDVHESNFIDLLKWMIKRQKRKPVQFRESTKTLPTPSVNIGIKFTYVNHTTFLIQANGINILTDPIWAERASPFKWIGPKRVSSPGIDINHLPKIDLILLSHNHYDHLDLDSLNQICNNSDPLIVTSLGVGLYLSKHGIHKLKELDWGQSVFYDNIKIHSVPAQHFSGRGTIDRNRTLWCGFVIEIGDKIVYFAGDTGYGVFLEMIKAKFPSIDIGLIPIGAYKPSWFMSPIHISPTEAVKIHKYLGIKKSIASHFGTFPLADEEIDEPIKDLSEAVKKESLEKSSFITLENGESLHT